MIKSALQYLMEKMSMPYLETINGEYYSDRQLHRVSYNPKAQEIEMHTLSSLVDYIKSNFDEMNGEMFIHVKSPTSVEMYSNLDDERKRESLVVVSARIPDFPFGKYVEHENFCVNLQAKFINDEATDKALILKFAGTVEAGTVAQYGDDGVTQKATVKQGISSKTEAIVPSPAKLKPFRTFVEVDQPVSDFIFRIKQDKYDKEIQCALFEADGGAWKNEAMKNIKEYLEKELEGIEGFIVIS